MSVRTQRALRSILDSSGWRNAPLSALQITPFPNMLPTSLPIGALAGAALGATGLAAAALWQLRSGTLQQVGVDTRAATLAMTSATYLRVNGEAVKSWDPITGYYRVRDGEWVYLHGNFAHLRDGLLKLFDVPNDPAALRAALATWSAADIEDAARGFADEWRDREKDGRRERGQSCGVDREVGVDGAVRGAGCAGDSR